MGSSTLWPRLSRWHLRKTSTHSIVSGQFTDLTWDSARYISPYGSPNAMWSSGATVTVQESGIYLVTGMVSFDASQTGYRYIRILVGATNEVQRITRAVNLSGFRTRMGISAILFLNKGDGLKLQATANTAIGIDSTYSHFAGVRLGRQ